MALSLAQGGIASGNRFQPSTHGFSIYHFSFVIWHLASGIAFDCGTRAIGYEK
jgi:hypothetical protein